MKKFLALLMALIMSFCFFGCDDSDGNKDTQNKKEETIEIDDSEDNADNVNNAENADAGLVNKDVTPKDYGKVSVVDSKIYNFNVGDRVVLVAPYIDEYEYYGVAWTGGSGAVRIQYDYNSPECTVTALSEGESTVSVYVSGKRNGQEENVSYEVKFKVAAPSPNSSSSSSGAYLGTQVMVDGQEYVLGVGDIIMFQNPGVPGGSTFAYSWTGSTDILNIDRGDNDPYCTVTAIKKGEGELTGTLSYYLQGLGNQNYTYTIKIKVVEESQGGSAGGNNTGSNVGGYQSGGYSSTCTRCYGTKKMECPTCDGYGILGNHACPSSYCNGGYVPCPCY